MSNGKQTDKSIGRIFDRACSLVVVNVLFLLCSLPVFTIGAAWTALYYAVEKMWKEDQSVAAAFFRSFKLNFKQATVLWLPAMVIGAGIIWCILYSQNTEKTLLLIVAAAAGIFWGGIVSWLIPLLSKFYSGTVAAVRNAYLCAIAYWPLSLVMVVTNFLPVIGLLIEPTIVIRLGFIPILIWFSLAALFNLQFLSHVYEMLDPSKKQNAPDTDTEE